MANELPLNALWEKLGCSFKEERDWRIPAFFKSPEADYEKARHCGVADLSFRGKVEVKGEDRISFLHNLLTNDIQSLKPGSGCRTMFLHASGKILADMNVHVFQDSVLLDMEMNLEKKLLGLLGRYIISEDVQLADRTEAYAHLSFQGVGSASILSTLFQKDIPARPFQHAGMNLDSLLICLADQAKIEYQLLISKEAAAKLAEKILANGKGLGLLGCDAAEILRIERGELRYGWDMNEDILLPETGLEKISVSKTKGCYPGQEVVARIETYQGLKRKIAGLTLESSGSLPASGDKISSGEKEIGRVTSSCFSEGVGKGIALGYLEKGFWEPGQTVFVQSGEKKFTATTATLPFVLYT